MKDTRINICNVKKGMRFFENDMHQSMEMIAIEDARLVPIGNGFTGDKWAVNVLTDREIIEISQNADFLDSYLGLKLSLTPEYQSVQTITFLLPTFKEGEFFRAKGIEIRSIALALIALKASRNWKQLDNLIEGLNEIYELDLFEDKL